MSDDPRDWSDATLARMHSENMGDVTIDAAFWDRFPVLHGFSNAARYLSRRHAEEWQEDNGYADLLDDANGYQGSPEADALHAAYRASVDKLATDLADHAPETPSEERP